MKRTPERNAELRRRREQRALFYQRERDGQCLNCGKSDWVDAIDNNGAHYEGCSHCVISITDLPIAGAKP